MRPLLIALISVGSLLSAQQPPSQTGTGAIEGQVRNATTGEPVPKASLLLRRDDRKAYSISSDERGHFALDNIEPGKYRLTGVRAGFVSAEFGSREPTGVGATLSLDPGQRLDNLVFPLTPHAVIAGRVVDEQGEPLPLVQVQALSHRYRHGRKQMVSFGSVSTNDLGEYRIFGLPPGSYYLCATFRQSGPSEVAAHQADQGPPEEFVSTYYPRGTDAASTTPIDAAPGAQLTGMDIVLAKSPTVGFRGRVSNMNGSGLITITLVPGNGIGPNRTYLTDTQGYFDLHGIAPGSYTFVASVFDKAASLIAKQSVDLRTDMADFKIAIPLPIKLTGRIRVEGDQPINLSGVRISLRPRQANAVFGPLPIGQAKEDGTFAMSDVNPDSYYVVATGLPNGYYVKSIRSGDEEILETGLDLRPATNPSIGIILSPAAGELVGSVLNAQGQAASGATVVLIPQDGKRRDQEQFYQTTTADQQGRFRLSSIDPGQYKLFAWEDVESDAYLDPEFIRPVEDKGEPVLIKEKSHDTYRLTLISLEPR